MGGPRIAFVSSRALPAGSEDDRLVLSELARRGADAHPRIWDDPTVVWSEFDLVVIRSTWDYFERPEEFLRWVEQVARASRLSNSAHVVRWNAHKRYLLELERKGIDIVPTELLPQHAAVHLQGLLDRRGWAESMIKPAIGGNAYRVRRVPVGGAVAAEPHLRWLLGAGEVLVQPFQQRTADRGERSLVYIDGHFAHAVQYASALAEHPRRPSPFDPTPADLRVAGQTLDAVGEPTLYARLDYLPEGDTDWRLGELELIEPELFFVGHPRSVEAFATACLGLIGPAP